MGNEPLLKVKIKGLKVTLEDDCIITIKRIYSLGRINVFSRFHHDGPIREADIMV